jgi:hypothetical protein
MIAVSTLIDHLTQEQLSAIQTQLKEDKTYAVYTLPILEQLLQDKHPEEIAERMQLNDHSYKVFERIIYRNILSYFEVEDKSVKDILPTTVFYAIYGINQKCAEERSSDLEKLFLDMKRHHIQEESIDLLKALYLCNKETQMETVYFHLYEKYRGMAMLSDKGAQYFSQMNYMLGRYLMEGEATLIRSMINEYKKIRSLAEREPESYTLQNVKNIARLTLVVICKQEQLLLQDKTSIDELISDCREGIDKLSFGMKKFYLKNIIDHLELYLVDGLEMENEEQKSRLMSQASAKGLAEAFNYGFPNSLMEVNRESHRKTISLKASEEVISKAWPFNLKNIRIPEAIRYALIGNNYGRTHLSHL